MRVIDVRRHHIDNSRYIVAAGTKPIEPGEVVTILFDGSEYIVKAELFDTVYEACSKCPFCDLVE